MTRTKRPRILLIYKKSAYQIYVRERKNARIRELVQNDHPSVRNVLAADEDHVETIEEAKQACKALGIRGVFRYRSDEGLIDDYDLVVTIGGDGTLLWASHYMPPGLPILAINSAPKYSVGHFCGGQKGQVQQVLEAALDGALHETRLSRMSVEIDGEIVHQRVLNDLLFCHRSPAATTRYQLHHHGAQERQKSSGIWVGPAAGSTAAQRSGGGRILPPASRRLQFVVREPYNPPEGPYRLRRGFVDDGQSLVIHSEVRQGRVFLDGPHIVHEVAMGTRLVLRRSEQPLHLLGFPRALETAARRKKSGR